MPSGPRRSLCADVLVASGCCAVRRLRLAADRATPVVVTAFSFASDNKPELYAAFLAVLVGLPGLLWTLRRACRARAGAGGALSDHRRQLSGRRE